MQHIGYDSSQGTVRGRGCGCWLGLGCGWCCRGHGLWDPGRRIRLSHAVDRELPDLPRRHTYSMHVHTYAQRERERARESERERNTHTHKHTHMRIMQMLQKVAYRHTDSDQLCMMRTDSDQLFASYGSLLLCTTPTTGTAGLRRRTVVHLDAPDGGCVFGREHHRRTNHQAQLTGPCATQPPSNQKVEMLSFRKGGGGCRPGRYLRAVPRAVPQGGICQGGTSGR